ncbi:hypothetical protein CANARDRAFT_26764 [[Candida] arabinofermentans NRRL YB-2248]|uniref:Uncharacterized protein n=1 Tax=[Candida] arabinofermentans NRRL YB-2248 TaxID=983967 RepID=A0A1E4T6K5_9ASCO|nr:hypothetical protein CANARDRAFT_26764 [[Candida] arabinofermentans NRRL YB-2248]
MGSVNGAYFRALAALERQHTNFGDLHAQELDKLLFTKYASNRRQVANNHLCMSRANRNRNSLFPRALAPHFSDGCFRQL